MKLRKKGRFFGFCLLVLLAVNALVPQAQTPENFKSITVCTGDTLWEIAQEYAPDTCDVRSFMWELKKINRLESGVIYDKQVLQIPIS